MTNKYPNSGALFKNTEKKHPNGPDYSGSGNIFGEDVYLDAWVKEGKNGKFLSVSVKQKQAKATAGLPPKSANVHADLEDDLPF